MAEQSIRLKDPLTISTNLRIVRVTLALIAMYCSVLGAEPAARSSMTDAYRGIYKVSENHVVGIDRFIMDNGEDAILFADYASGIVRRLFPVNDTEFVMGPGFNTAEPAELLVHIVKSEQGKVTGLSLHPTGGTRTSATPIPRRIEAVSFTQADAKLSGTLILPASKGPHPAIILLHGSGPLTRHSFGPYPYFFSSLGLAVLIYDKRGTGASTGWRMDASTGNAMKSAHYPDDLTNDALAALRFLQQHRDIDPTRIGLWGSSEGGMLTTQVAARSHDVLFAINSSGFMEPLWKTLQYQIEPVLREAGVSNDIIQRQAAFVDVWLDVARTGKGWEKFQKQEQDIVNQDGFWFFQSRGKYNSLEEIRWDWNHVLTFNPLPALAKVTCPVLGVFGEVDPVTPAHRAAENMRQVLTQAKHKDFTVKIFPQAGHSLSTMPSKNQMAPGVFETLRSWINERIQPSTSTDKKSG